MPNLSSPYVSGGDAANMSTSEDALIIKPQAPIKNYERALGELASQYGFGGRLSTYPREARLLSRTERIERLWQKAFKNPPTPMQF